MKLGKCQFSDVVRQIEDEHRLPACTMTLHSFTITHINSSAVLNMYPVGHIGKPNDAVKD